MSRAPVTGMADVRLVAHEVLDSTNAEALRLAETGERGPLWIVARRQTAGRGRRGRAWVSDPGNLFATLLLAVSGPAERWSQLSFVAALALHDALASLDGVFASELAIKWPNDLLLRGRKVAGILVEGEAAGTVAIGIGVNCASHPREVDYPAADLASANVTERDLMPVLADRMRARLAQWDTGEGFPAIRADWVARATGIGSEVRIRLGSRELIGRFEEVDSGGALMLRLPDGRLETIAAGDVLLLRPERRVLTD